MGGHAGGRIAIGLILGLVFGLLAGPAQAGQPPAGDRARAAVSQPAKPPKPPKPPKPVVKKVKPGSGPTTGGTKVRIKGKHLTKVKKVLFGTARGTGVRVKSKRKLTVIAPPHAAGRVAVRVVTKGGKSKKSRKARFTYVASTPAPAVPVVTGLTPASGPTAGGTTVNISGTGLTGATSVSFGGVPATLTVLSDSAVRVTTPAHTEGSVPVTVRTPGGTSTAVSFTYEASSSSPLPPVVVLVAPLTGPVTGGTEVTITGTGFTGATAVEFDGMAASFTVDSDTSITATTPAHAEGLVAVSVTTPAGTSTVPGLFTYLPLPPLPPVVVLVAPLTGPAAGGTVVTITGTGFSGATAVSFGGTPATSFTVDSDLQITATTPAHAEGLVDVAVTTPAGTSSVPGLFTYLPVPPVPVALLATPLLGSSFGGQSVTITGTGFSGATEVSFGGTAASFTVVSDLSISASTPAHAAGPVMVSVTTPGGTSVLPALYVYV